MARACIIDGPVTGLCVAIIEIAPGDTYTPPAGHSVAPNNTGEPGQSWTGTEWTGGPNPPNPASGTSVGADGDVATDAYVIRTNSLVRATVDSTGRMMVGHDASVAVGSGGVTPLHQVAADTSAAAQSIVRYGASADPGTLLLGKSRGALGAVGQVLANDVVGRVEFVGADTVDLGNLCARVDAIAAGNFTTTSTPGEIAFLTTPSGSTTPVERVRIHAAGEVVVGAATVVPNALLHVNHTGAGNSFQVDDATDPDATPFVIDATGRTIVGHTAALTTAPGIVPGLQQVGSTVSGVGVLTFSNAVGGPRLTFAHSYGATVGDYAALVGNAQLGSIEFAGSSGSIFELGAHIRAVKVGTAAAGSMATDLVLSVAAAGSATPSERLRITNTARLGLNTAAPAVAADLRETAGATAAITSVARLTNTAASAAAGIGAGLEFAVNGGTNFIGAQIAAVATDLAAASEDFDVVLSLMAGGAAAAEKFRFVSTGHFKIGANQVLGPRVTGWAAPTGTATRTTFATSTVTTAQLAERVKALIDDLTTHGVIGA